MLQASLYWEQITMFHKRAERIFWVGKGHSQLQIMSAFFLFFFGFYMKHVDSLVCHRPHRSLLCYHRAASWALSPHSLPPGGSSVSTGTVQTTLVLSYLLARWLLCNRCSVTAERVKRWIWMGAEQWGQTTCGQVNSRGHPQISLDSSAGFPLSAPACTNRDH